MLPDADLLILGGGCAGLSLAMRLAALGSRCPRTVVLENRRRYVNDRTWCFWGDEAPQLRHLALHQWSAVTVKNAGRSVRIDCSGAPYQMLAAEHFYKEALAAIAPAGQISLLLGVPVVAEVQWRAGRWQVETAAGRISAARVVDTRPLQTPARGGALLWQSFYGHEIECEDAIFDPECASLMDFLPVTRNRIAFVYVLPVSRHRALVEVTVFGIEPLQALELAAELDAEVAQRVNGAAFTVLRSEHGILPMGSFLPASPSRNKSYVRVGLTAGGARPATGYAFQRIQRWATACASAIAKGGLPIPHLADPLLLQQMDRLFLKVIRQEPAMAPLLFMSLFERVDAQRVIRFLSDRGSLADYAAIVFALPSKPFLSQLFELLTPAALRHEAGKRT
jgi:lycopene beta-cyclase